MRRRNRCLVGLLVAVCAVVLLAAGCSSGGSSERGGSGNGGGGSAGTSIAGSGVWSSGAGGGSAGEGVEDAEDLLDPVGCSNGEFVKNRRSRRDLVGDCEALVAVRNSLMLQQADVSAPETRFDPGWGDGDISDWERIEIRGGRVVSIDMRNQFESLSGQIPPEIGQLDSLERLDFTGNWALEGPIPPEIGNLTQLEEFNLISTGVSGEIPPEIGKPHKNEVYRHN